MSTPAARPIITRGERVLLKTEITLTRRIRMVFNIITSFIIFYSVNQPAQLLATRKRTTGIKW